LLLFPLYTVYGGILRACVRSGLSLDLAISREYGWFASQRFAAVTRPVGIDAGQRTEQNRGAAVKLDL